MGVDDGGQKGSKEGLIFKIPFSKLENKSKYEKNVKIIKIMKMQKTLKNSKIEKVTKVTKCKIRKS